MRRLPFVTEGRPACGGNPGNHPGISRVFSGHQSARDESDRGLLLLAVARQLDALIIEAAGWAVPPEPLAVFRVPDDAPAKTEQMGTKPKFWFSRDQEMWLFKSTRPGSGEHWAEVLAAGLAEMLGLPHARYELARWRDTKADVENSGVVTRRFTPAGFDLVHGKRTARRAGPELPACGGTLRAYSGAHDRGSEECDRHWRCWASGRLGRLPRAASLLLTFLEGICS